jgi:hypothetical protein
MSGYFDIKLKDLETVKSENSISWEGPDRIEFNDNTVIIQEMFKNFGKTIKVRVEKWEPYDYRDTEGKLLYSDKWVLKEDPVISKLFDELLEVL